MHQSARDRIPVALPPALYSVWLDPALRDVDRAQALLTPYPAEAMLAYPVSTRVNRARRMTRPSASHLYGDARLLKALLIMLERQGLLKKAYASEEIKILQPKTPKGR